MNVKPLILAAALGLALNAHAAPNAKTVKKIRQTRRCSDD